MKNLKQIKKHILKAGKVFFLAVDATLTVLMGSYVGFGIYFITEYFLHYNKLGVIFYTTLTTSAAAAWLAIKIQKANREEED